MSKSLGFRITDLMMVNDDDIHAEFGRPSHLIHSGRPIIHGHQDLCSISSQTLDSRDVESIALSQTMGNVHIDFDIQNISKEKPKDRRTCDTIDVIISVDSNFMTRWTAAKRREAARSISAKSAGSGIWAKLACKKA